MLKKDAVDIPLCSDCGEVCLVKETLVCSCDHIVDANKKVTRFEVIDHTHAGVGRILVSYDVCVELSYQDDGTTLKVFMKDGE